MPKPRKVKLAVRRFEGDDTFSWAVFYANDVNNLRGQIVQYGDAEPILCGVGKQEADRYKTEMEKNFR